MSKYDFNFLLHYSVCLHSEYIYIYTTLNTRKFNVKHAVFTLIIWDQEIAH